MDRYLSVPVNREAAYGCLRVAWAHYSFKVAWVFADTWKT